MKRCKEHDRYNCYDYNCTRDNAGDVGIDTSGNLTYGLGGGLGIDTDGDLTMNVGGVNIDLG